MKELVEKIQEKYAAFATDAALQVEKGNKAAGTPLAPRAPYNEVEVASF